MNTDKAYNRVKNNLIKMGASLARVSFDNGFMSGYNQGVKDENKRIADELKRLEKANK